MSQQFLQDTLTLPPLCCRALEYVDIAARTEPTSVFNAFLKLKVHLLQKDSTAAADQIKAMMKCDGFSHEILRVSSGSSCAIELLRLHQIPWHQSS